jgi:phage tail sheath protein FI
MALSPLATKTPGVYIDEKNGFPNSAIAVATAIPAFVGYTPKAEYEGESFLNTPLKISSFQEFQAVFMLPNPAPPAPPAIQYSPQYHITEQKEAPAKGKYYNFAGRIFTIEPDPGSIYYLYNSVRLFYQNGGGTAYIVSVGTYGSPTGSPIAPGGDIVNPNVSLKQLQAGIELLNKVNDATMYVVPEATLLSKEENGTLMQSMLIQNGDMGTAMSIFDIIGGRDPDPILYMEDITNFRNSTGNNSLKYGAAYYPYLITTITPNSEMSYENINGGDSSSLEGILSPADNPNQAAIDLLAKAKEPDGLTVTQINQSLLAASKTYGQIMKVILNRVNTLPPSGAMAGIYTLTDNTKGVWFSPANVTPVATVDTTLQITDLMQADLNVDAVSGKSVNAIRFFNGNGILVWGARTLDGNSLDWRYINVRRTVTMIEQSVKLATRAYVFSPNDANTWTTVKSMISNFLTNIWTQGGLQGAKPGDAFSVSVGLGITMTGQDILEGIMRVSVKLAVVRPAEFIIIEVEQQMPKS